MGILVFQQEADGGDFVGQVDPGQALAASAKRSAGEQAHGQQHERQDAAFEGKHDGRTKDGTAHAQRFDRPGGGFPIHA